MFVFTPLPPAGLPSSPAPQRAAANTPNLALLLGLLHTLIGIGHTLVDSIEQQGARLNPLQLELRFQTTDLRLILARVLRGLHRATALYQRLAAQAATGRDLAPNPPRPPAPPGGRPGGDQSSGDQTSGNQTSGDQTSGNQSSGDRSGGRAAAAEEDPAEIMSGAALQRIVALAASEPAGAVLAEICRDLGIFPGVVDPALAITVYHAIRQYNGSVQRWLSGVGRDRGQAPGPHGAAAPPQPPARPPEPPPPAPSPVPKASQASPGGHSPSAAAPPSHLPPPMPPLMPPPLPERMAVAAGPP